MLKNNFTVSLDVKIKNIQEIRYISPQSDDFLNVFPLISASFLFHLNFPLRLTQKQLRKINPEEKQLQRRSTFSRSNLKTRALLSVDFQFPSQFNYRTL